MENIKNTPLTEKKVRKIMGNRQLVKRTKQEITAVFSTFGAGVGSAILGIVLKMSFVFFSGMALIIAPLLYVLFFDKKRKAAERYFLENWRKTGQLLPKDWRYTGK